MRKLSPFKAFGANGGSCDKFKIAKDHSKCRYRNLVYYYRPKCREQVVFGIGGKGD